MSARPRLDKAREGYNAYLHYTGLGLTMMTMVVGSTVLGHWLDGLAGWRFPLLTLLLALLGLVGAMVHLFRSTRSENDRRKGWKATEREHT